MRPTVHLLGPSPHSSSTVRFEVDAFAAKCRRLASMLTRTGYDVRLYYGPENTADVAEHIALVTADEQERWFPGFDPTRAVFNSFDRDTTPWRTFNERAIVEVRRRARPGDILGCTMGRCHESVATALVDLGLFVVETGVGYPGVFAPYRVFESYAWAHHMAGQFGTTYNLRFFDTVIPNSYDAGEFPKGNGEGGFQLFMGRIQHDKGLSIAVEATRVAGIPLKIAGPGGTWEGNHLRAPGVDVSGSHIEYLGVLDPTRRAEMMGAAAAVWTPTTYLEPFGSVATEAMSCGTPVIASDWGAFTETVIDNVTGYRCRTLREFVRAARNVGTLDRDAIREYAGRFSTEVTRHQYDRYFRSLATLNNAGWYDLSDLELQ